MKRSRRSGLRAFPAAAACAIVAAGLCLPFAPAAWSEPADEAALKVADTLCVVRECPPCVVRIEVRSKDDQAGSGTGILLKDGRVLTAAHLLRNASEQTRPQVLFGGRGGRPAVDGAEGRAVTWTCSPAADLAVIRGVAVPPWAKGVPLAAAPPKEGETLTAVGLEHNNAVHVYSGALLGLKEDTPLLALGLATQRGDSGGPVFNAAGAVVGILSGSGKFARTTTTTEEVPEGTVETTEKREIPASFAVDLGKIDWKGF